MPYLLIMNNEINKFAVENEAGMKVGLIVELANGTHVAYTHTDIELYRGKSFEVALWAIREGQYL